MNILKKIKGLFYKNNENIEIPKTYNNIQFLLDENQDAHVKVIIADTSQNSAEYFADMLYGINNGQYLENILQVLIGMGKQDEAISDFVRGVVYNLSVIDKLSQDETSLEPQVKPTDFFQGLKNGT